MNNIVKYLSAKMQHLLDEAGQDLVEYALVVALIAFLAASFRRHELRRHLQSTAQFAWQRAARRSPAASRPSLLRNAW